jgi:hypothetical protein
MGAAVQQALTEDSIEEEFNPRFRLNSNSKAGSAKARIKDLG